MLIVACVSSHGYGHGSRVAAVLTALHDLEPSWRLVLSTALPPAFLELAFGPVPFERRPCRWDVGVIQADALGADPEATLAALDTLDQQLPLHLETEALWLQAQQEPVLVLGDVPPAAALLAERVGAPLVWLASFGWEAIYGPMGGLFTAWADRCHALYQRGDLLLRCPLAMPMDWGISECEIGLTAGRRRLSAEALEALVQELALPVERERCVMISFGGMGAAVDPALLDRWPDHVFIGADPELASRPNGRVLPKGLRPLELMPRCGRLITKPGYSSFCEAMTYGVGIHLVEREGFAEAPVLQAALQRHGWHRLLSREQFACGDWQLDQPLLAPAAAALPGDGALEAARLLASLGDELAAKASVANR